MHREIGSEAPHITSALEVPGYKADLSSATVLKQWHLLPAIFVANNVDI